MRCDRIGLVFMLLLCAQRPTRADELTTLLGVETAKVIGRGALVVVDTGAEPQHDLRIVDLKKKRYTGIEDSDYVGTRRATVRPFLGSADLVEVVLFVDAPDYERERHIVVRTSGKELTPVCEIIGDEHPGTDPATKVTIKKSGAHPYSFDLERVTVGGALPSCASATRFRPTACAKAPSRSRPSQGRSKRA